MLRRLHTGTVWGLPWLWDNGEQWDPDGYQPWDSSEPDGDGCMRTYNYNELRDSPCSWSYESVCEKPIDGTTCPSGYTNFDNERCLKHRNVDTSWNNHQAACAADGATMMGPPLSVAVLDYLDNWDSSVWLGANHGGAYARVTRDGSPYDWWDYATTPSSSKACFTLVHYLGHAYDTKLYAESVNQCGDNSDYKFWGVCKLAGGKQLQQQQHHLPLWCD